MEKVRKALVVGATGMVGLTLSSTLVSAGGWTVYGLSRRRQPFLDPAVVHVPCDLSNRENCMNELSNLHDVTHVFYATWRKGKDEQENIDLNCDMLNNMINGLMGGHSKIQHFGLVTGTKHYMGPFSVFKEMGQNGMVIPFRESHPRVPCPNFYYDLEDILFAAAEKYNFTWSVARPAMIVGIAPGNEMNMMTSIGVYASLCKHSGLPFVFPGSSACLDIILDAVDVKLLANHIIWESKNPDAKNQAFNIANGDVFVWRHLWTDIANYFGIPVEPYPGQPTDMQQLMDSHEETWGEIVKKHNLKDYKMSDLATWWMVNASLNKASSCVTSVSKSRAMGFHEYADTPECIFKLFDYLRESKYLP